MLKNQTLYTCWEIKAEGSKTSQATETKDYYTWTWFSFVCSDLRSSFANAFSSKGDMKNKWLEMIMAY